MPRGGVDEVPNAPQRGVLRITGIGWRTHMATMTRAGGRMVMSAMLLAGVILPAATASAGEPGGKARAASAYSVYKDDGDPVSYDDPHATAPFPNLASLSSYLLESATRMSKYRMPEALPMVSRVPRAELEKRACPENNPHCQVAALFEPERGIMIAEDLRPETNIFHRSILFHEIVHYMQEVGRELATAAPCERWYQRELEAYSLQNRFLTQAFSPDRVSYSGARPSCEGTDDAALTHRAKTVKAPGVTD